MDALPSGVEHDVGGPHVERVTLAVQGLQFGQRVIGLQEWPVAVVVGAQIQLLRMAAEVDHGAARLQPLPVEGVEHGAAASAENDAAALGELVDDANLALAETRFSLDLEDGGYGDPATGLDRMVRIDEFEATAARQQAADGRLAGAHQADEKNIGAGNHGWIVGD